MTDKRLQGEGAARGRAAPPETDHDSGARAAQPARTASHRYRVAAESARAATAARHRSADDGAADPAAGGADRPVAGCVSGRRAASRRSHSGCAFGHIGYGKKWWVLTGSNRRHSPCKGDALPAELSTHVYWRKSSRRFPRGQGTALARYSTGGIVETISARPYTFSARPGNGPGPLFYWRKSSRRFPRDPTRFAAGQGTALARYAFASALARPASGAGRCGGRASLPRPWAQGPPRRSRPARPGPAAASARAPAPRRST